MTQEPLFHEDIYEALKTDVQRIGGAKKVGSLLWPEKMADKAGETLNNCLNVTRPEKLDPEQVMLIKAEARKVNSFAAVTFENSIIGLRAPEPLEPEDEQAKLYREYIEATKLMKAINDRMERVNQLREVS